MITNPNPKRGVVACWGGVDCEESLREKRPTTNPPSPRAKGGPESLT